MSDSSAILAAAHEYRRRGWRVIQLHSVDETGACSCKRGAHCGRSAGKHPIVDAWQNSPAYSGPDIEALWEARPNANIGIATGEPSGFWVLDIDPEHDGLASMAALVAEHGALPQTWVAQTGSGGYHYAFELPEDFEVKNDQSGHVGPGLDVRGKGGQIVAPPSVSGKGPYTVVVDAPIAPAPAWLLELVKKPERADIEVITAADLPRPEDISEAEWARLTAYAKRAIDSELERLAKLAQTGWKGEPWNHTTFEVACTLIEFANSPWNSYSLGHARADVMAKAPRDKEGFDDFIVAKTFQSALDRVGDKARPLPPDRRAEPDPLMDGVPLRGNPTPGAGDRVSPDAEHPTRTYFGGDKGSTPIYPQMAAGVVDRGPIGWGRDNDFWSYADGVWAPDRWVVRHRLIDILGDAYKTGHYPSTMDIVQRHAQEITGDPLEHLMNFRNGMLDWRNGILEHHDPAYGSTVQFGTIWDPEAQCPHFDAFLAEVMHEDYVELAWEMLGYLMLSGNPLQVAFMLYGSGGNGKGTLLRVMTDLLGHENVANESLDDLNGNRFRSANLFGKIANIAGDIDSTYQESTAAFKKITGEDEITAERKNIDSFKFENWAVPVFSANKFPGSADVTEGYLRRWVILHFHKRIEHAILGLSGMLAAELPGIAVKAVTALRTLMERGTFDPRGEATKGKEEFHQAIDRVRAWAFSGDPIMAPESVTPLMHLYSAYSIWAERAGQRRVSEHEFSNRLAASGFPEVREGQNVSHIGLIVADHTMHPTHIF